MPIGEWVPGGEWLQWSGLSAVGGLQPGNGSRLLDLPNPIGPIAGAICYELADGSSLATAVKEGAEWILTVANLDPYPLQLQQQFLALAQLRAIETGRWLLSVGNTGPTAVLDATGKKWKGLEFKKPDIAAMKLKRRTKLTFYDQFNQLPLLSMLAISAGGWLWFSRSLQRGPLLNHK